jgi:hypothetical protein
MNNGTSRNGPALRSVAIAVLLTGAAAPVCRASSASAADESAAQSQPIETSPQDIVVTGQALFPDIQPERNLDTTAIGSYGVSTVDDLLAELQAELGDEESPLLIVNGQRVNDIEEIGAFPVEVLHNLQVLPRGSAVKLGGTSGQRVISLTLNHNVRTATATVAPKFATDGGWHSVRGEGILTKVSGSTRANIALRVRDDSSLLESERDIIQPDPFRPFALSGNVIGFPDTSGEIDPILSALAGETVTVAPLPGNPNPTLADFLPNANLPAVTDVGQFRTLRPNSENYDLSGTFTTRLAPWLTSTASLRLNRSTSRSLRGLPSALLVLGDTNPESPFSRDVGLAFYGTDPLHYRSERRGGEGSITFNGQWGSWSSDLNLKHNESEDTSRTQRVESSVSIPIDDSVNPFAIDASQLIPLRTDRTSAKANSSLIDLTFTGPLATLPAGPLQLTIEGRLGWNSLHSKSTFSPLFGNGSFRRNEQSIRGSLDIPLTSRDNGGAPGIGDSSADAEYSLIHYSDAGTLHRYALGLTWEPMPAFRVRAAIEKTDAPPPMQLLGDPVVVNSDVRTFDPETGETVDVTQITGGNPFILPQSTKIWRLTALARLVPRLHLQLNGEYTDTDIHNFVSSLPEASAEVMLAFPDRYVRDTNGTLATVDLRPVNFQSEHEKRFRWGLSMNAKLAGGQQPAQSGPGPRPKRTRTTYLQLTANHTVVFSDQIRIRPGLDPVDLLGGGAIGIGGGRLRHQVDGTAAITSGGLGVRIGATWRGPSALDTRIGGITDTLHFSPVFLLNLRAFADMKQIFPGSGIAKGLRLSLNVTNLTNDRQKVRNSLGITPLQYQPGYRDPLGRTIEFEIRKVF